MKCEIIYSYFYDVADRIDLESTKSYLKGAEIFSFNEYGKAVPEGVSPFELPLVLDFQKKTIKIDDLKINANIQFIIYSVGVIAIRIRIPMENFDRSKVERLTFDKKIEETFKRLSEETKADIQKRLSKYIKIKDRSIFEMYRVYFIQGDASEFILENKKWIAGILLDEQNYENLSNDYVDNTIKRKLSYYNDDLIITDWDAAFIISRIDKYENEMTVIDTSNVQLLEYIRMK